MDMDIRSIVMITAAAVVAIYILIKVIQMYNLLVGRENAVCCVRSSLDALLKKRCDLVPNLVAAVRTYMVHESTLINRLTEIRAKALSGVLSLPERMELDKTMSSLMHRIVCAVENYPSLWASNNFLQLQAALNEVEEQISAGRRALNASVMDYNNAVRMFPTNILALIFNYRQFEWYTANEGERAVPNVNALFRQ
ncbi:MAG TPA: LemA family protein [Syntrophales bacterium]|jgi:LemA protein|nr:LemA family protein [Syntrophales bacterium]HPC34019.1 LemA family protein [Syntrophales bacterium]